MPSAVDPLLSLLPAGPSFPPACSAPLHLALPSSRLAHLHLLSPASHPPTPASPSPAAPAPTPPHASLLLRPVFATAAASPAPSSSPPVSPPRPACPVPVRLPSCRHGRRLLQPPQGSGGRLHSNSRDILVHRAAHESAEDDAGLYITNRCI